MHIGDARTTGCRIASAIRTALGGLLAACVVCAEQPVQCSYRFFNVLDEAEIQSLEDALREHAVDGQLEATTGKDEGHDYREYTFSVPSTDALDVLNKALPRLGGEEQPVRFELVAAECKMDWRTVTIAGTITINAQFQITPGAELFYAVKPTEEEAVPEESVGRDGTVELSVSIPRTQQYLYARTVLGEVTRYLRIDIETGESEEIAGTEYHGRREDLMPVPAPEPGEVVTTPEPLKAPGFPDDEELTVALPGAAGATLVLRRIAPGEYTRGSQMEEVGRADDEGPAHTVKLTRPFYIGKYEVTQLQWEAVMESYPSSFARRPKHPVEQVPWRDAEEFCKRLTEREHVAGKLPPGEEYRLPTEAEWEYACRAGTSTRFPWGDDLTAKDIDAYAWFHSNSAEQTHEVGQKKPNAWGLHDMIGNVWEWCSDVYGNYGVDTASDPKGATRGSLRIKRGGSWGNSPEDCRPANRFGAVPGMVSPYQGFRVVRAPRG